MDETIWFTSEGGLASDVGRPLLHAPGQGFEAVPGARAFDSGTDSNTPHQLEVITGQHDHELLCTRKKQILGGQQLKRPSHRFRFPPPQR